MSYTIIIPSFKREHILVSHTLKSLARTDVCARIIVFTADEEETAKYRKVLPDSIEVITGVRGLPQQHNHIQRLFPEGEHLLFMDDDLKSIIGLDPNGKRVHTIKMHEFILTAFQMTKDSGKRMFGINSTNSNLEMKHTISVGRIYLVGNFYGWINSHTDTVDVGDNIPMRAYHMAGKESHERSLQQWDRYGGVLKFRSFGVVSKYWGVPGGLQVSRTPEGEEQAAHYLHSKYPTETAMRYYKGVWDLVIKPKTKVVQFQFVQESL